MRTAQQEVLRVFAGELSKRQRGHDAKGRGSIFQLLTHLLLTKRLLGLYYSRHIPDPLCKSSLKWTEWNWVTASNSGKRPGVPAQGGRGGVQIYKVYFNILWNKEVITLQTDTNFFSIQKPNTSQKFIEKKIYKSEQKAGGLCHTNFSPSTFSRIQLLLPR